MPAYAIKGTLLVIVAFQMVVCQPENPLPMILGGFENVANTATNFLLLRSQGACLSTRPGLLPILVSTANFVIILIDTNDQRTVDSAASRGLEFKLRRFLEKFRRRMPVGIPELGIPPLEPLHLDEINLEINNRDIGNVSVTITDLTLYNLSTFVVNKAKLSLIGPTIAANVSIPRIYMEGFYNVSGILGFMVPLHGGGPFKANINDFQLYVNTVLGYSRGVYLRTFDLDFSLKSIDANLENLMQDQELNRVMSKVFQELTPEALDIIKPEILPGIRSYIGGSINDTIHHLTMRDIISVLVGQSEIREFAHFIVP